ncbi:hypothetical protein RRG08_054957, partial [Elysia crispata]
IKRFSWSKNTKLTFDDTALELHLRANLGVTLVSGDPLRVQFYVHFSDSLVERQPQTQDKAKDVDLKLAVYLEENLEASKEPIYGIFSINTLENVH